MDTPRISVVIITYNQSNLISRSVNSVLKQKDFIYELIISDDCSTDNTWDIIKDFQNKYPDKVKIYRNTQNLGIFKHIEKTWNYPTGDVIFYLAGDDEFCDGVFEKTTSFILKEKIDFKNEYFTIYFDYVKVYKNGFKKVYRNNLIKKYNPISLKIRNLISNRTTGVSINVLRKFKKVENIGIFTDGLQDIQTQFNSKTNYYIKFVASKYYSDIGIGSRTYFKDLIISKINLLKKYSLITKQKDDINWINYQINRNYLILNFEIKKYFAFLISFSKSITFKFGIPLLLKEIIHFLYSNIIFIKMFLIKK